VCKHKLEKSSTSQQTTFGTTQELEGSRSRLEEGQAVAKGKPLARATREPTPGPVEPSTEGSKVDRVCCLKDYQRKVSERIDSILLSHSLSLTLVRLLLEFRKVL